MIGFFFFVFFFSVFAFVKHFSTCGLYLFASFDKIKLDTQIISNNSKIKVNGDICFVLEPFSCILCVNH